MQESTNREKVLKKIRASLLHKTPNPYPNLDFEKGVFATTDLPAELVFAEKFEELGGLLVIVENKYEIIETLVTICKENKWLNVFCVDKTISSLLDEVNFSHQSIFDITEDKQVETAIIKAEALIANSGQVVINLDAEHGRTLPAIAENLVIICPSSKLTSDLMSFLSTTKASYNGNQPSGFYFISPNAGNHSFSDIKENIQALTPNKTYVIMLMEESE